MANKEIKVLAAVLIVIVIITILFFIVKKQNSSNVSVASPFSKLSKLGASSPTPSSSSITVSSNSLIPVFSDSNGNLTASNNYLPVGTVWAFAMQNIPSTMWIPCDGRALSRSTYSALFSAIGTTHGQGDGSTTFNIPDYQGRVLRHITGSTNRDPDVTSRTAMNSGGNTGALVGSVQTDMYASHTHTDSGHTHSNNHASSAGGNNGGLGTGNSPLVNDGLAALYTNSGSANIQASGGNETRMKNAYIVYGIKVL